jgi:hypothetical protein
MNNNKVKKYLVISLLVNAFLIGILVSGITRRYKSFEGRKNNVGRFLSSKNLHKKGQRIKRSKEKIKEALLKEPFDEALVRKAFDKSLEERTQIQKEVHEKIKEKIISEAKNLLPEERVKLLEKPRRERKNRKKQKDFRRKRKKRNRY